MNEWLDLIKTVGLNVGAFIIIVWWLTQYLIPQLQKERSEAIQAFHEELAEERKTHTSVNERQLQSAKEERDMHREDRDRILQMYNQAMNTLSEVVKTRI